jgi:hypothetical protein
MLPTLANATLILFTPAANFTRSNKHDHIKAAVELAIALKLLGIFLEHKGRSNRALNILHQV